MPAMRNTTEGNGYLRCQCGTRIALVNGLGRCTSCGLPAEVVISMRRRHCALHGCDAFFMPNAPHQKTCCPDHARLYQLQEQRRRSAEKAGREIGAPSAEAVDLLGPEGPLLPARNCHDCGKPTRQYRCMVCRERWRRENGLTQRPDLYESGRPCIMDECPV